MTALLSIRDLKIEFKNDEGLWVPAVHDVSFDVEAGRVTALVGESGSGKSVSSLAVMDLLPHRTSRVSEKSEILFNGASLLKLPKKARRALLGSQMAMVFQDPMTSLNPVMRVGDQVAEMLRLHTAISMSDAMEKARILFDEVGLPDPGARLRRYPHQLSGGQQQRVMIAMSLACNPKLLIADEPTTALDVTIQAQILELLSDLQKRHHMALLFITHDLGVVADIADSVVVMREGRVRESGLKEEILFSPKDPYTRALLASRPPRTGRPKRLAQVEDYLKGQVPSEQGESEEKSLGAAPVILKVEGLTKHFDLGGGFWRKKTFTALKGVSLTLKKGETLGIVGESGSGKTTLGLTLMRLHEADGGSVYFDGVDVLHADEATRQRLRRRMQIVFQNPYASLNPRFTVADILLEPMQIHGMGKTRAERLDRARTLLAQVGLPPEALSRYPHEFSGGQRQRIAIARCLTLEPELLVLDESVSALDVSVQAQVLNLLKSLQETYGLSYLFISHDLSVVRYISDRVLVMKSGEVVEEGESRDLFDGAAHHPYTQALLAAIPGGGRPVALP